MVRYSFLVRLSHPLLYAGLSRRILDNLVRPEQHGRRNREADLLGRLEIDDQLEFRGASTGRFCGLIPLRCDRHTKPRDGQADIYRGRKLLKRRVR
jgi:hypothetical protein